jgi:hypothetical protein
VGPNNLIVYLYSMFLLPSAAAGLITHVDCISRGIKRHVWRVPALLHQTRTHFETVAQGGGDQNEKISPTKNKSARTYTQTTASVCVTTQFHLGPSSATITDSIDWPAGPSPTQKIKKADDRVSPYRIECQLSVHSDCYTSCYKRRGNRFIQSAAQ